MSSNVTFTTGMEGSVRSDITSLGLEGRTNRAGGRPGVAASDLPGKRVEDDELLVRVVDADRLAGRVAEVPDLLVAPVGAQECRQLRDVDGLPVVACAGHLHDLLVGLALGEVLEDAGAEGGEVLLLAGGDLEHEHVVLLGDYGGLGGRLAGRSCGRAAANDAGRVEQGDGGRVGLVADLRDVDVGAGAARGNDMAVPADVADQGPLLHAGARGGTAAPVVHVRVADFTDAVVVDDDPVPTGGGLRVSGDGAVAGGVDRCAAGLRE